MFTCMDKTSVKTCVYMKIIFVIWIFTLNTSTSETIKSNNSDVTTRQQRMFGNFGTRISSSQQLYHPEEEPNNDYEWKEQVEDYKNTVGNPKFMTSDMSMQPSNHKYSDYIEKEYDSYGPPDEYYSHDYMPSHSQAPPMYSMIVRQEQSLTSKLSNLVSMDTMKILLILLMKMMLIKLKALGFLKMLILILMKLPILFFGFITKVVLIAKLANFLKLITLPIVLPIILLLLAPLLIPLLLPLLLIPLLLPLLLFLPIPVLTVTTTTSTTTTTTVAPVGRRRRRRYIEGSDTDLRLGLQSFRQQYGKGSYYNDMLYLKYVAESEQCLERIACKLAADERSLPFKSYVIRILDTAKGYLENSKLDSYVSAYKFGAIVNSSFEKCVKYYRCSKFKS